MLVKDGVVQQGARYLRDGGGAAGGRPADAPMDGGGRFTQDLVSVRKQGDFRLVKPEDVTAIDVSPKAVGVGGGGADPVPGERRRQPRADGLQHAGGQAVPLIRADAPLVGTGMEAAVARDSGATIVARRQGIVDQIDGARIVVRATNEDATTKGVDIYRLRKFMRSTSPPASISVPLGEGG